MDATDATDPNVSCVNRHHPLLGYFTVPCLHVSATADIQQRCFSRPDPGTNTTDAGVGYFTGRSGTYQAYLDDPLHRIRTLFRRRHCSAPGSTDAARHDDGPTGYGSSDSDTSCDSGTSAESLDVD
jgi:hypothetical protein